MNRANASTTCRSNGHGTSTGARKDNTSQATPPIPTAAGRADATTRGNGGKSARPSISAASNHGTGTHRGTGACHPRLMPSPMPPKAKLDAARATIGPVEGHDLSDEQLAPIVGAGRSTLVLAGAGTGKTTTINGHVAWLLATGRAKPEEILVLSFTKSSADEMSARIRKQTGAGIRACTFHSLGLDICRRANPGNPLRVADETTLTEAVRQTFSDRIGSAANSATAADPATARYRKTVLALMPKPIAGKYRAWASPNPAAFPASNPLEDPAFAQCADHLLAAARTIILHMRANALTVADLRRLNRDRTPRNAQTAAAVKTTAADASRNARMIDFLAPLHEAYQRRLDADHAVDFAGMITEATRHVREGRYASPFRFILIDEYQDMSRPRYELIRALREQTDCSLFAVGDDWQSIYRFAGSDVSLILDFDRLWRDWGPTRMFQITATRRFRTSLIEASGAFVMADPDLYVKHLHSLNPKADHSIKVLCGRGNDGDTGNAANEDRARAEAVVAQLAKLPKNATVMLLGRYASDLDPLLAHSPLRPPQAQQTQSRPGRLALPDRPDLDITFMTVHKSKGLQRDFVFLLATSGGPHGFPSAIADEPLLDLLLPAAEPFPYAEERRLFYVAMTRCVKKLFIVVDRRRPSRFVYELRDSICPNVFRGVKLPPRCPDCGEALVLRASGTDQRQFYGCTNWPLCAYTCAAA
ncbi:UvrD-helicase domain-containing protein [Bifidobacterium avesanii]|nr:UvrD-helicase domain-containing protein [Bifidobacterium avesanii]